MEVLTFLPAIFSCQGGDPSSFFIGSGSRLERDTPVRLDRTSNDTAYGLGGTKGVKSWEGARGVAGYRCGRCDKSSGYLYFRTR